MTTLSIKHQVFCTEYLKHFCAARAAKAAGSKAKRLDQAGYELLKKPEVREYLSELLRPHLEHMHDEVERTLREIRNIAFSRISDVLTWGETQLKVKDDGSLVPYHSIRFHDPDEISSAALSAIAQISQTRAGLKVRMHDKLSALDKLARYYKLYSDGAPVNVADEVLTDEELAKVVVDFLSEGAAKIGAEGKAQPDLRSHLNSAVEIGS